MSDLSKLSPDYKTWILDLKYKIRLVQIKTAVAVNAALIEFYWELGKMISEKQTQWGTKFLETTSNDLRDEFPDMKGFSVTNLKYCRNFYDYFVIRPQVGDELQTNESQLITFCPQVGDELDLSIIKQIPWGHIKIIIDKIKDKKEAKFYIEQTIENNWSRDVLANQINN